MQYDIDHVDVMVNLCIFRCWYMRVLILINVIGTGAHRSIKQPSMDVQIL